MTWWAWTLIFIYVAGFVFIFIVNMATGPVTLGLSFMRALTWPIWVASGFFGFDWLVGVRLNPETGRWE